MVAMTPVPTCDPCSVDMNADRLKLVSDLQRYAGWLDKDHVSVNVRADVSGLAAAMHAGYETSPLLQLLADDIKRLQSGGVRTMLRRVLRELQALLERSHPTAPPNDRRT